MTAPLWMTTKQVAVESGRHHENVLLALRRGHLTGVQRRAGCPWRITRKAFDEWMQAGARVDDPVRARLRRSA
jgi:hypothetical protein